MSSDYNRDGVSEGEEEELASVFVEMAARTDRCGVLERPDGHGLRVGDCGDTVEMFFSLRDDVLQLVVFRVEGCLNTLACANTVTLLMEGKTLDEAWQLTPEQVIDYLQSLPPDHYHCAELAVGAFYAALADYSRRQKESWKDVYIQSGAE